MSIRGEVGYEEGKLSDIIQTSAQYIYWHWRHVVERPGWLTESRKEMYARVITEAGCPDATIIGFLDGTHRGVARPRFYQRIVYNGWKHGHSLLFIAVCFPDGTFLLRGPVSGRQNDLFALRETGLWEYLSNSLGGYAVGGDGIFPTLEWLHSKKLFMDGLLDEQDSTAYSSVRICVEWLFGIWTQNFRFFMLEEAQQLGRTYPALHYNVGAILGLALNVTYGNKIADFFSCATPTLETVFTH